MSDLLSMAMEATKQNVVKSTRKENINEALMRRLYHSGEKWTRLQLINALTVDRLANELGEEETGRLLKDLKAGKQTKEVEEFRKKFNKTNMTVKNGIDTSVSHSQNNSSFHYNPKYKDYKLEEVAGKWQITKRENAKKAK
jgi:hypothetical protein